MRVMLFPGQGSQSVGMGQAVYDAFPEARLVFQEVDDALSCHLSRLIFSGDPEELTKTMNAQPALMCVSIAVLRVLEAAGFVLSEHVRIVAGHSLGEYTALVAAGSIGLSDAARLLRQRGQAMQDAVPSGGGMSAILGVDIEELNQLMAAMQDNAHGKICQIANDNTVGQVVISGHSEQVLAVGQAALESGKASKVVPLPVSAPFHCALMQPAADVMVDALQKTVIKQPIVPILANVTVQLVEEPAQIRDLLVQQVTATVRWRESMVWMIEQGVEQAVEVGAGRVLSGLFRRMKRDLPVLNIHTPQDVEQFLQSVL